MDPHKKRTWENRAVVFCCASLVLSLAGSRDQSTRHTSYWISHEHKILCGSCDDARELRCLRPGEGGGEALVEAGLKGTASLGCGCALTEKRDIWGLTLGHPESESSTTLPPPDLSFVKVWSEGQGCQLPALLYSQSLLLRTPVTWVWEGGPHRQTQYKRVENKLSKMWIFTNPSANRVTTLSHVTIKQV